VIFENGFQIIVVVGQQLVHVELRGGVEMLVVAQRVRRVENLVEILDDRGSLFFWEQHQRILIHRRADGVVAGILIVDHRTEVGPPEGVHPAGVLAGVGLKVPPGEKVEV